MPSFYSENIDIEVNEFLSACNKRELQELIEALYDDGHLEKAGYKTVHTKKRVTLDREEYINAIDKLHDSYYSVSQEDVDLIKSIANKY